jgi:hypothetical protein
MSDDLIRPTAPDPIFAALAAHKAAYRAVMHPLALSTTRLSITGLNWTAQCSKDMRRPPWPA